MSLGLYITTEHDPNCSYRNDSTDAWRGRSFVTRTDPNNPRNGKVEQFVLQCRDSQCLAEATVLVSNIKKIGIEFNAVNLKKN